jgi:hypothetical protein
MSMYRNIEVVDENGNELKVDMPETENKYVDYRNGLEALKAEAGFADESEEDEDAEGFSFDDADDEDDGEETNVDELLLALEKALDNENNED